jgi:23S rRNA (uracil1939-C5)-methyltransferase
VKLRIEKAVYGGACLAHVPVAQDTGDAAASGKTVFVPYSLPGELVEARVTDERRSFANGELESVIEASPDRVQPGCEYFPACGGCQYQHAAGGYQLRMKAEILADTFRRAHVGEAFEAAAPLGMLAGPPWGYRNRIRVQVVAAPDGQSISLCYRERGTHSSLAIGHCPIAAPLIERAMAEVLRIGREAGLARLCNEMEFFSNGDESELLIGLLDGTGRDRVHGAPRQKTLDRFSEQLKAQLPELAGVGILSTEARTPRLANLWGQSSLRYSVLDRSYQVSLGSFFQINRFLLPEFVSLVIGGRSGRRAWDLYAGVGLFSRGLNFERVVAVEAALSSSGDLKQNLEGTGHRAVSSTTLDFLRAQAGKPPRESPELIVLDPPRAGLGPEICRHLDRIAAAAMVYVSCDPATLARDLQALLQSRYRLESIHLIDLFPQTFHLETVAVLARR